jgi:hypothetical protein
VLFIGQAEIMTNMGPVPLSFEIDGRRSTGGRGLRGRSTVAIERTVQQIQEMRRQAASQLVVPQGGMPNLGPAGRAAAAAARSDSDRGRVNPTNYGEGCWATGSPPGAGAAPRFLHHQQIAVLALIACFVRLFITTMLMRRLIGLSGADGSSSTLEARPTTRPIFSAGKPPAMSARRAALARSAESSQFV